MRWAGTPIGTLLPHVAEELGLSHDVVVAVGGQDQKCAALGAGIGDGSATVSLGTASAIVQVMDRPATDPRMRIPTFTFVQPARWVLEGVVGTAAGSLRWYRDTVAPGIPYSTLDAEAAPVPPGSDGVLFYPHLGGAGSPHWLNSARGTFHGLSLATTRGHLTRAVLEGVAYQIRENLTVTEEIGGPVAQVILYRRRRQEQPVAGDHRRRAGAARILDGDGRDRRPGRGDAGRAGQRRVRVAGRSAQPNGASHPSASTAHPHGNLRRGVRILSSH